MAEVEGYTVVGSTPNTRTCTIQPKLDESKKMKVAEFHGKKTVKVHTRPVPMVTDPEDIVLKVTSTAICGSDLHLYVGAMPGMKHGDVFGHEFMGVVEEVGPGVRHLCKGDRVVTCFDIGCGRCWYCDHQLYSSCDTTNPSKEQQVMMGSRSAGFFGYSHLTGGWQGGQAEYVRVPFADLNCLKVPDSLQDTQVLFLSDILPTAWHATELGDVHEGDFVAIWGAGPVGILAAHCAFYRKARRVILIDREGYRLEHAEKKVPGVEVIDFSKVDTLKRLAEMVPEGPDVVIEAVGCHYAKTLVHKVQMAVSLETDTPDVINECIRAVKKGGRVSVVGAYVGYMNGFNFGAFMEKGLVMRAGQTPCQKYWHHLLSLIQEGALDPTIVITHEVSLDEAPKMYNIFNDKKDGCIKVVMHPHQETTA